MVKKFRREQRQMQFKIKQKQNLLNGILNVGVAGFKMHAVSSVKCGVYNACGTQSAL